MVRKRAEIVAIKGNGKGKRKLRLAAGRLYIHPVTHVLLRCISIDTNSLNYPGCVTAYVETDEAGLMVGPKAAMERKFKHFVRIRSEANPYVLIEGSEYYRRAH